MRFYEQDGRLIGRERDETVLVEAWGVNALRVRATKNARFSDACGALEGRAGRGEVSIGETGASIENGMLRCEISARGWMRFFRDGKPVLKEYYRDFRGANEHSPSLKLSAREYRPVSGNDYEIFLRFEAADEKLFGMGQYQQPNFDLKGCILELAQRNSQISVPFCLSERGYGFLWNNPCVGEAMFGANYTQWHGRLSEEIDYWITADRTPKEILSNYTEVTGRAPIFPENALGLWQSKLRYRTQDEVLQVAREYRRRGLPLDVIVIDFFHWIRQGDWSFDPLYFPDPEAMTKELAGMGTRCMVSIWPTVDRKSVNFSEMLERGLFIRTERGSMQCFDFQGDTVIYDATNPEARAYLWERIRKNYYEHGIDMFWLDEAEPEYAAYDYEHFRHYAGPALKVGNLYPREHARAFYEGMKAAGQTDIVNLLRCAWAGSQKYAAVVWSGDVLSTFASLRDQFAAGLNIGIAGIPWWTTDTGGFFGDVSDPHFNELLIRWFEFSVFCPVLRMHGDRGPHDIPPLSDLDYGGGFSPTGRPNELWSFGEEVYSVLKKYLLLRLSMHDYLKEVMAEASDFGYPVMRAMFLEFPDDENCWECKEQYMFGSRYLVAPVLWQGMRERDVYLPRGEWRDIHSEKRFSGGRTISVKAPLEIIPVFEKL